MRMRWAIAAALMAALALAGCRRASGADDRPTVTVSIPPQAWMLEQIAGHDLKVNTLLPPGADAETFEPSMQAQRDLERSCEYAMVGTLPFEQAILPKLHGMYPDLLITETFHPDAAEHDYGPQPLTLDSRLSTHHHEHDHGVDPHVWTTPEHLQVMADSLLAAAIRANPSEAPKYRKNHVSLSRRLTGLQAQMERDLAPLRGRDIVIWHPSLSYMAEEFGFRQVAVQEGHKEPSPRRMGNVIDQVSRRGAVAFVIEKEHSPRMAEALNADMRLPLVHTSLMQPDIVAALSALSSQLSALARNSQL